MNVKTLGFLTFLVVGTMILGFFTILPNGISSTYAGTGQTLKSHYQILNNLPQ